ncbi:MAG TPA: hypothetical protein PKL77_08645 [Candidatus Omnitrophota bacterium]|nr:hypothetical protein [Candidatus Omnitrophota bacterium]
MGIIKLSDYARAHGVTNDTLRRLIREGHFPSAHQVAGRWYIDSDEPYPIDKRVTHGAYIGIRDKIK